MSSLSIIILLLSFIVIISASSLQKQVSIKCWPTILIENINNGRIDHATADMSCKIEGDFYKEDILEVTAMKGLYREYENLLLELSFDHRYQDLPIKMPKGIGRIVASSRGHRLKNFTVDSQLDLEILSQENFANMPELERLKITKNPKVSEIPQDLFSDLTTLVEVRLDKNRIRVIHPDLLKNLILLEIFSATGNPIEIIEEHLFRNNRKLKMIDFSDCKVKKINEDFRKLPNIDVIKVTSDGKCNIFKTKEQNVEDAQNSVAALCKK